jgi:outer membrane biosynthesis protein TonB
VRLSKLRVAHVCVQALLAIALVVLAKALLCGGGGDGATADNDQQPVQQEQQQEQQQPPPQALTSPPKKTKKKKKPSGKKLKTTQEKMKAAETTRKVMKRTSPGSAEANGADGSTAGARVSQRTAHEVAGPTTSVDGRWPLRQRLRVPRVWVSWCKCELA